MELEIHLPQLGKMLTIELTLGFLAPVPNDVVPVSPSNEGSAESSPPVTKRLYGDLLPGLEPCQEDLLTND